jgi:hypothetical protein
MSRPVPPVPPALALRRIEDAIIEDIMAMPADDLRQELMKMGEDPDAMVRRLDDAFAHGLAAFARCQDGCRGRAAGDPECRDACRRAQVAMRRMG